MYICQVPKALDWREELEERRGERVGVNGAYFTLGRVHVYYLCSAKVCSFHVALKPEKFLTCMLNHFYSLVLNC